MKDQRLLNLLLGILICVSFFSCSTLKTEGNWGKNAGYPVKKKSISNSFFSNAVDPNTWLPLVGASVIYLGDYDHKISAWATKKKRLFGGSSRAKSFSDIFKSALSVQAYGSVLLTPSGDLSQNWRGYGLNKVRGAAVVWGSIFFADFVAGVIKSNANRERPDKKNDRSFPSGHATGAASYRLIISRNLDVIELNPLLRKSLKVINTTFAISTAWARVEGKRHYPVDVLVGYSLGNFLTGLVFDSLINYDSTQTVSLYPSKDSVLALYGLRF